MVQHRQAWNIRIKMETIQELTCMKQEKVPFCLKVAFLFFMKKQMNRSANKPKIAVEGDSNGRGQSWTLKGSSERRTSYGLKSTRISLLLKKINPRWVGSAVEVPFITPSGAVTWGCLIPPLGSEAQKIPGSWKPAICCAEKCQHLWDLH